MAAELTNYQCPNCTAPLHFEADSGNVECDHCGTDFEVSVIELLYADKEQKAAAAMPQWDVSEAGGAWSEEETAHLRAYNCPSCAAQLLCDDTTAATSCPYCDNPTVIPARLTGALRPDYVIPFGLDRASAVAALKRYYKGKKFLPRTFLEDNHIEEVKGVYVPFWLFDGQTDANLRFRATLTHTHQEGDYMVTVTQHYRVVRQGTVTFERVPVDGSTKMPDQHMDSIEPFSYSELKPFSTAYLPGFLADKYDLDAEACSARANERIRTSTEKAFAATASHYTSLVPEHAHIDLTHGDVKYALLPVWMLSTRWRGQSFLFAMNGQTGKLIGDLPIDWRRVWAWFAGISLPLMAVFGLIAFGLF